jgi:hypothetical protein
MNEIIEIIIASCGFFLFWGEKMDEGEHNSEINRLPINRWRSRWKNGDMATKSMVTADLTCRAEHDERLASN